MRAEILVLMLAAVSACGPTASAVPVAGPIQLSSGTPIDDCEKQSFLELVPSRAFSSGQHTDGVGSYSYVVTTSEEAVTGLAIRRDGKTQHLSEVLDKLDEPQLRALHMGRIDPIRDKQRRRKKWRKVAWWGTAIALAGGVAALATVDDPGPAFGVLGVGATIEIVGIIGFVANGTTAQQESYAGVRNLVLIDGEDDLAAAARGVDRHNAAVTRKCGHPARTSPVAARPSSPVAPIAASAPPAPAPAPAAAAAAAPAPAAEPEPDVSKRLDKLDELRASGTITEQEYGDRRKAILDSL